MPCFDDLFLIREQAAKDRSWSAAVAAETARGRAAGFHKNQTTLEVETKSKVTVIELVAGVKD